MGEAGTLTARRQERQAIAVASDPANAIEQVLIKGDLKALTPEQRNTYYLRLCEMTGLNPMTQPFEYLTLNGKLVLYAKKACTDQLRALHQISVVDMDEEERRDVCIVTVKVQDAKGRTDMGKGAVNIAGLKGDPLANAIMKAETKAKRRATLSICGLGLLDETEVETVPQAAIHQEARVINPDTGRQVNPNSSAQLKKSGAWDSFLDKVQHYEDSRDLDGLKAWYASDDVAQRIASWPSQWRDNAEETFNAAHDRLEALGV